MAQLELTPHLTALFPQLERGPVSIDASDLSALVAALDERAPGIAFYICDERGRLRRHVNIFVDGDMLVDRKTLGDSLQAETRVFIAQALSGGSPATVPYLARERAPNEHEQAHERMGATRDTANSPWNP